MSPELKAKWTEALRSGRFVQTTSLLRGEGQQRCCLGVLCEVGGLEWRKRKLDGGGYWFWEAKSNKGLAGTLSRRVLERFGLPYDQHCTLYQMNDSGTSFDEIAQWIDAHVTDTSEEGK